jgi:poly(A) polymerase
VVGQAWRYLKELRLDRGPLSRADAEAALLEWARERGINE